MGASTSNDREQRSAGVQASARCSLVSGSAAYMIAAFVQRYVPRIRPWSMHSCSRSVCDALVPRAHEHDVISHLASMIIVGVWGGPKREMLCKRCVSV